mgnify:CR=1 FL=1
MIKNTATIIVIYTALAAWVAYFYFNLDFSLSILLGGLIMLLNLAALAYVWSRVFAKKSIALAVFIIIFKYVILGMILWGLSSAQWLKPAGFLVGITSLVVAVVFERWRSYAF